MEGLGRILGLCWVLLGALKLCMLPTRELALVVVGLLEMIIGSLILRRGSRLIGSICSGSMVAAFAGALVRDPISTCHCIGSMPIGPSARFLLIAVLGVGSLVLCRAHRAEDSAATHRRLERYAGSAVLFGAVVGFVYAHSFNDPPPRPG